MGKKISIEEVNSLLPEFVVVIDSTYLSSAKKALFIDEVFGIWETTATQIIVGKHYHPKRALAKRQDYEALRKQTLLSLPDKECTKCHTTKSKQYFRKTNKMVDGYSSRCRKCLNDDKRLYRIENKEKIKIRATPDQKDIEKLERKRASARKSNKKRKVKVNAYFREWRKKDVQYKIRSRIRERLCKAIKYRGVAKRSSLSKLIGCDKQTLKAHLERLFLANMTWDNYGKWHIDHIKPLALFDLSNPIELALAAHYTNLQPLWAADNLKKGDKYP